MKFDGLVFLGFMLLVALGSDANPLRKIKPFFGPREDDK